MPAGSTARAVLAVCSGDVEPRPLAGLKGTAWRVQLLTEKSLRAGIAPTPPLPERAVVFVGLPTAAALEVVRIVRQLPLKRIVVISACGSIAGAVEAMRAGAHDYLCEPVRLPDLLAALGGRTTRTISSARAVPLAGGPTLDRAIWEHINHVLVQAGTLSETARRLGVQRRSLRRMLDKIPPMR